MVLSRSRRVSLFLLASLIFFVAMTSASDELSAEIDRNAQESDRDSKTDATLASTQYHPVYDSQDPESQEYHHSDNSEYYTSRSRHDGRHADPNNQYYIPREQQHHAYAEESERNYNSEQYKDRQYNSRPPYEQYESHGSYYEQEHQAHDHYKQHQGSYMQRPAHKERNIVQVCLQKYGPFTSVDSTTYTQEFVCCNGPALDDSCIRNSTYGYGSHNDAYEAYEREDSPSFMDTMLTPQIAAVCTFDSTNAGRCPEWAQQSGGFNIPSPGCIAGVTVKCAFTKYASQCGCPAHAQGLEFESHTFLQMVEGISCGYDCLASDPECLLGLNTATSSPLTAGGPYSGTAALFQGGLSEVFARGEAVRIEGSVEFAYAFFASDDNRARHGATAELLLESLAGQDLALFKSGQMKVRLAVD